MYLSPFTQDRTYHRACGGGQKTQKPQADEKVSIRVETSCSESGDPEIDLTVIQTTDDLDKYGVSK